MHQKVPRGKEVVGVTADLSTLFLLPVYANLFTVPYVLLLESEKISKMRGPSSDLRPVP